ncbi:SDR family NAD(P)-dependent oxidoreductase [Desertivirga brevis]|uniref:SDR family NAD(P)-dependent oxidoreductase n=1 Tax=Desertivirga brevis TaxID=2810310 RepID=UPI001A96E49B|nr:SDR family oxidoreductase [Pedobacter sp. SYSU D00873]
MNLQLESQVAFITGSTQGIGFAIAKQLLAEGANVIINGRTQERVDSAIKELQTHVPSARVFGLAADFSNSNEVYNMLNQLPQVDILINNVGVFSLQDFASVPDDEWNRLFEVNVMSGIRLSRHLLPKMLERNRGRIIFITSESGIKIPANMIPYAMTKTAMLSISRGLAELTRNTNVTVNAVVGGPTYSEGVADAVEGIATMQGSSVLDVKKHLIATISPTSLIQRFIEPEEISSLVAYLASPLSSATNGAALRADGGVLTGIL